MAASIAKEDVTQETQKYYVLLIITVWESQLVWWMVCYFQQ